jgi:V/A-type H+/Na+-transporting ATPase subunit F
MAGQKIVAIGGQDAVFGMSLIGLEGRVAANVQEARRAIRDAMADPDVALLLLTEDLAEARPAGEEESHALIVEIPCPGPPKPSLALQSRIEQALGVRLEH